VEEGRRIIWDKERNKQLKRRVEHCVVPAYMYDFDTSAVTEKVAENNWVRIMRRVNREDSRKTDELRLDIGMKTNHLIRQ
jgi:hypothetical protein